MGNSNFLKIDPKIVFIIRFFYEPDSRPCFTEFMTEIMVRSGNREINDLHDMHLLFFYSVLHYTDLFIFPNESV